MMEVKMKVKLLADIIVNGKPCKAGDVVDVEGVDYVEIVKTGRGFDYTEENKEEKKEEAKIKPVSEKKK